MAQILKIIEFQGRDRFKKETENLGERIREYRRVHGLTQKKLDALSRVDQTRMAGLERGEHRASKRLLDNFKSIDFSTAILEYHDIKKYIL
ncbi:MAG: helix-turn-helix transcriptional regulator [Acidobacteriota bacterium]